MIWSFIEFASGLPREIIRHNLITLCKRGIVKFKPIKIFIEIEWVQESAGRRKVPYGGGVKDIFRLCQVNPKKSFVCRLLQVSLGGSQLLWTWAFLDVRA